MILSILKILDTILQIFGMEAQRRKEIQASILKHSIGYKKDSAKISNLRNEYAKLLEEINRERKGK